MDLIGAGDWEAVCRVVMFGREHLSPGCVDLIRHSAVRVYSRPQERRLIEDFCWTQAGVL